MIRKHVESAVIPCIKGIYVLFKLMCCAPNAYWESRTEGKWHKECFHLEKSTSIFVLFHIYLTISTLWNTWFVRTEIFDYILKNQNLQHCHAFQPRVRLEGRELCCPATKLGILQKGWELWFLKDMMANQCQTTMEPVGNSLEIFAEEATLQG